MRARTTPRHPGVPGSRATISAGGRKAKRPGLRPVRAAVGRLLAPTNAEAAFVEGLIALTAQGPHAAKKHFEQAGHPRYASPAFYQALCEAQTGYPGTALARLIEILASQRPMPDRLLLRYVNFPTVPVQITPAITIDAPVSKEAAALLAAELYQRKGDLTKAIATLQPYVPGSAAATLSLAELYAAAQQWDDVVSITDETRGKDDLGAQALVLRARAFAARGENDPALAALKEASRAAARRPLKLVVAARYERGLIYQAIGDEKKARAEFAAVLALDGDSKMREHASRNRWRRSSTSCRPQPGRSAKPAVEQA